MAPEHDIGRANCPDDQIKRLAGRLRKQGVAPPRDLWPAIDRAISTAEQHQIRPTATWRRLRPGLLAAAAVLALVAVGWWNLTLPRNDSIPTLPRPAVATAPDSASDLDLISDALAELNLALAADPDNRSLDNLALMLHRSRGRLLRQNTYFRPYGG